jgi:hypothetical protein
MNHRKSTRHSLLVDIEIAHPGVSRCRGFVKNISRDGLSVILQEGQIPDSQKSVLLNFKIWTGSETLFRKLHAKIVRVEGQEAGLVFAENDLVANAIIQDLLHYKSHERRKQARLTVFKAQTTDSEIETLL